MANAYKIGNKYRVYTHPGNEFEFEGYLLYEVDGYVYLSRNRDTVLVSCISYSKAYYKLEEVVEVKTQTKLKEYLSKHEELQKLKAATLDELEISANDLYFSIARLKNREGLTKLLSGTICIDFVLDSGKFETVFKDADDDTWLITPEQFEQWKTICLNWNAFKINE